MPYSGTNPLEGDEFNSPLRLRFFKRQDLIYYRDFVNGYDRLYIPLALKAEIFEQAYN